MTLTKVVQTIENMKPFESVIFRCPEDHIIIAIWFAEWKYDSKPPVRKWYIGRQDGSPMECHSIMEAATAAARELEHIL